MVARTKEKPHNRLIISQVPLDSPDNSAVMTGDVIKAGPLLCHCLACDLFFNGARARCTILSNIAFQAL